MRSAPKKAAFSHQLSAISKIFLVAALTEDVDGFWLKAGLAEGWADS